MSSVNILMNWTKDVYIIRTLYSRLPVIDPPRIESIRYAAIRIRTDGVCSMQSPHRHNANGVSWAPTVWSGHTHIYIV